MMSNDPNVQNKQQGSAAPREQEKGPVRRVGVFTMGLCLIFTGVLILLSLFHIPVDLTWALRLSPLFLVILGGEMLCQYVRHKGERLQLDFFSTFCCFILIFSALACSAIAPLFQLMGPAYHKAAAQISQEIYNTCYGQLQGYPGVSGLHVSVELLPAADYTYPQTAAQLSVADDVYLNFSMDAKEYRSAAQFAQACHEVLSKIDLNQPALRGVTFDSKQKDMELSLRLRDMFSMKADVSQLERMVKIEFYESHESAIPLEGETTPVEGEDEVAVSPAAPPPAKSAPSLAE